MIPWWWLLPMGVTIVVLMVTLVTVTSGSHARRAAPPDLGDRFPAALERMSNNPDVYAGEAWSDLINACKPGIRATINPWAEQPSRTRAGMVTFMAAVIGVILRMAKAPGATKESQ